MSVYKTAIERRTIRRYKQYKKIDKQLILKFINSARYAPAATNLQPVRYMISDKENINEEIFKCVRWANYIYPSGTPKEGEKPSAYIIILLDNNIKKTGYEYVDIGLSTQNILLTAWEDGIGGCLLGAINRKKIRAILKIPERYEIALAISLGYIDEFPVAEEENGSIKYYKDKENVLHVPKRKLDDIVI